MLYALFTDRILQRTDLLKSSFSYSDFPAKRNRFKIFSSVPDLRSFAVYRYFNCERPGKFPFPKKYGGLTRFDLTEKELKKFDRIFLCRPFAFSEELQSAADALGIPLTEIILKPLSNEDLHSHLRNPASTDLPPLTKSQRQMNFSLPYRIFQKAVIAFIYLFLFPYFKIFYGLRITNRKVLRKYKTQGLCFVSNHCFLLDGPMIHVALFPYSPYITAWEHTLRNPYGRFFLKACRVLPIDSSAESFMQLNEEAAEIFRQKNPLLFYPEGSLRPFAPALRPFIEGAFFLAALQKVNLAPIVITFKERKIFLRWLPPKITLSFLEPIETEKYRSKYPKNRDLAVFLSQLTHERMSAFMREIYDSFK